MTALRLRHQPPALPARILVAVTLAFAALTIVRGVGWITGTPEESLSWVVLNALGSSDVWGGIVVATGCAVLAAYASRIHPAVWAAHGIAACVYLLLTVALAQAAAELGSGWQHAGPPAGAVLWHTLLAWLTGPLPPRQPGGPGDTR